MWKLAVACIYMGYAVLCVIFSLCPLIVKWPRLKYPFSPWLYLYPRQAKWLWLPARFPDVSGKYNIHFPQQCFEKCRHHFRPNDVLHCEDAESVELVVVFHWFGNRFQDAVCPVFGNIAFVDAFLVDSVFTAQPFPLLLGSWYSSIES